MTPYDTDVFIVGAGPTGLMLANQLARRHVRVTIVDRHGGPARETRALGVQARTLEIYAHLGIVARALDLGRIAAGANVWADGRRLARVSLGDAGEGVTPYPYILILGQDDNERIMGDRLREQGVTVQWNTELVACTSHADHVAITCKEADGTTRTSTAAWIAGCDGAHSAVRTQSGIGFPGAAYEHVFFVADAEVTGTMVPGEVNVYLWRSGFHLFFPLRGKDHWRLVGIVPAALRARDDLTFDDIVPSLRHEAGDRLAFARCSWFSTYRIHHRRAARFRAGRAFLLGDAAHVHSPVGAQGMNTGLQDAYNLAWKLALVTDDEADAALLDSYEAERVPVADRLLATTDRAFRVVISDHPLAGLLRTKVLARLAAFGMRQPRIQAFVFRIVSQTAITYRGGPLAQSTGDLPHDAPAAGDRFPWMELALAPEGPIEDLYTRLPDTVFHLLAFGQPAPADDIGCAGLVHVHAVTADGTNRAALARARIPVPSFYLMRPDGHVALCGRMLDVAAVRRYLRERVMLRDAALQDD
ncbi:MAG TPA: FAD-dependent monooxygenase [Casimicrobiaceae bacterium]|nr:FAD-dependent monooxygenase [Casimicrobiaceae bacterium]